MSYRITVDTGGTFTDVVVADREGNLSIGKAPTTQERIFRGMEEALGRVAGQMDLELGSLLGQAELLVYGTTRATNAIIERKTAKTAFLVTEGFPDILVLREGGKFRPFDFTTPYPEPYVPRRLTFEVRERIDSEGEVVQAFDEERAREVLATLRQRGIEAVAVCFLWSVANPSHEEAMGRLIEEELPNVPYTLSHQLNPILREYRRASSAAIDASLKPLMQGHLREMGEDLRAAGFDGDLLAATSFGGAMHIADLIERPIYSVRSGPALAPVAGQTYGEAEARTDASDIIVCDTGGTSFDVSLIRDGQIKFTRETWLGEQFTGHLTGLSSVDVRSIGSGGGSIAWIDPGGLLRVGPESSGADPGPACYGRGGAQPTVTDAALVLGYIDPEYFLGGEMALDEEAAHRVVSDLAEQLGEDVEKTAHAVLTISNEHMVNAIQEITVNEGVDPRDSLVVAGGGAAGLGIVPIALELGCRQVLVPRTAGALSACGAQYSDIVSEFSTNEFAHTGDFPFAEVNGALETLESWMGDFAAALERRGLTNFEREYFVEARYPQQVWELEVPLEKARFDEPADVERLVDSFHEVHERVFAVREPGQQIECPLWKSRLIAVLDSPPLHRDVDTNGIQPTPRTKRQAFFAETGRVEASIFVGDSLEPGMSVEGPAVIEEPTTTIVVYPGSTATVTALNNYLLEVT